MVGPLPCDRATRRRRRGVPIAADFQGDERPLPSGVVSFLLTDVVDSTALWERAPEPMDSALARHDALITASVEAHGGLVLKHKGEGDSTFCVFESASSAAAAATEAQRRLAAETWPPDTPIHVRMGIHSGEAFQRGRDYYGQTVNRAARVRALAAGGQVLLSSASASLVGSTLPDGTELRFLRSELLRGIDRLEAIHELVDTRLDQPRLVEAVEPLQPELPASIESWLSSTLVGREELVGLVDAARERALAGSVQTVLVGGEPGAGKSSLAAIAARRAHDDGWTVLFGSCDEHVTTPYEPFRAAVGQYLADAPASVLAEHIAAHGGEVGRLTANLSARVGSLPPLDAVDPETSRRLLFESVIDLLCRASTDRPVLLVLDDVQWADRNTLLLATSLARANARLVLLATYRSTSTDRADFDGSLARLRALQGVTDIAVGGLSEAELVTLLEAAAGHSLDAEGRRVAQYLRDETGGNPFFVGEVVRHFVETGVLAPDASGTWRAQVDLATVEMPSTVRAVLGERISRLGGDAQRILGLASIAGRQFDSAIVTSVLDIDEIEVLDTLEIAVRASLVRELSVGQFEFTHALVQHALHDELSSTRRALHHRQLALALEASGEASAAEIATHWAAAGPDSLEKGGEWAARAGEEALAALSPEDAVSWFVRALEVIADEDDRRVDLLIALGNAQRWGDPDSFRQTLLDAAALAERRGDEAAYVRAALANNRGGASRAGVVDPERVEVLERAIELVGPHDSTERARLLGILALELSQGGEWERRLELADDAVACARRLGDESTLLRVLLHTTEATRLPTTLEQRLVDTGELFAIAKGIGDPVLMGIAALREARVKIEAAAFDELDDALRVLDNGAHLDPYLRLNRPSIRAVLAHVAGDFPLALALAEEAREVGGTEPDAGAIYAATTAQVLWDMGSLGSMVPMIEKTLQAHPGVTGFRGLLGAGYCEVGRFDEARAILHHELETDFAEHPLNPLWLITMSLFASLCIELEDSTAAPRLYEILDPWRGRANASVVSINGLVTESLAGLAFVMGDLDRAASDASEALEQARRVGARVSAIRTQLVQARLLGARSRPDEAGAAVSAARAVEAEAAAIGMATVERTAARLAESIELGSAFRR